ncbi:MAG: heat-inducible transcriptional repressor HrcA [Coriobacteriia bacterium]|nr:heat-inducible transcriptional repressor HrcA [Coriobacteriia bacterium]
MLSDRRQRILAALIEEYVNYALPVGSRTLTERYQLGVSSATIRNELSALEDEGYISQPHTSAGRVPTDTGYRAFVDDLIENGLVPQPEYAPLVQQLRANATQLDALMEQTTALLAHMTDCLSIVMAPAVFTVYVQQITLISLTDTRLLMVVVTQDGQVLNRQLEVNGLVTPETLAAVQAALNQAMQGRGLGHLEANEEALCAGLDHPLACALFKEACEALRQHARRSGIPHGHRLGLTALMAQPEFSQSQTLVPLMNVLEDDTVLLHLLDNAQVGEEIPRVFIGRENPAEGLQGVSVVANHYGRGDAAGIVAVIGPTRMDYSKVLNAVRMACAALRED